MSTPLDNRWSMVKESTYGTQLTTSRFYPRLDDCKHEWDPRIRTSPGLVAGGRRSPLGSRAYAPSGQGKLTLAALLESKAAGVLLDWALGVSTLTAVTGGSQVNFHYGLTGPFLPSATVQFVDVMNDGTEVPTTYRGVTPTKVTIEGGNEEQPKITVEADALARTKATGAASKSYTQGVVFDAYQASHGLGGSFTAPTTTAFATGPTAFGDVRSWKVEIDQKAAIDRWNQAGGVRKQPTAAQPDAKVSLEIEHNVDTVPVALDAGTKLPWQVTYTTAEAVGPAFSALQIAVPQMLTLKAPPDPKVDGSVSVFTADFDIFNDGTNQDLWVCYRTLDSAL